MPPLSVRTPAWFVVSRPSPRPGSSLPRPPRPPRPCACSITVSAASVTEMTRSFLTSLLRLLLEAVLDAELHDAQEDTRNAPGILLGALPGRMGRMVDRIRRSNRIADPGSRIRDPESQLPAWSRKKRPR